MAWITIDKVEVLLRQQLNDDQYAIGLIDHAQSLAEIEVGTQTEPVEPDPPDAAYAEAQRRWRGLQAVLTQIVARMWQAGKSAEENPSGAQTQVAGPFTQQHPNAGTTGLGLTNREKQALRHAAGKPSLWVQPTTRGDRLETAPIHDEIEDDTDPIDQLAAAQQDVRSP